MSIQKQLELEEEMGSLGVTRYFKQLESQGLMGNPVGMRLLDKSLSGMIETIEKFCKSVTKGQSARHLGNTAEYFTMIGHKEVAYITLKRIVNGLSSRDRMVAMAESIAVLLEDELNYRAFRKEAPRLMDRILKNLEGSAANAAHKRKVIMGAKTKLAGIDKISLPTDVRIKLGLKLIELTVEMGLTTLATRLEGKNRTVKYVEATPALEAWIEQQNKTCALLSPVFLPMVTKPAQWTTPFNGGYLSTPLNIMKVRNKAYLAELGNVPMPILYEGLNALQSTPWMINKGVYHVMSTLWNSTGGGLAGLPFKNGITIPQKPMDINTNEEARKLWIGTAAGIHTENFRAKSKVIAMAQKLWVAEKFVDVPEIFFPHVIDWRGRAYAVPGFVNPQSDDSGKALLSFAIGKPLGDEGVAWLAIHLANTYGYDKVTFEERIQWTVDNTEAILDSALKSVEGNRFWLEADKPFQFLAACFEWVGYTMQGKDYVSHLPVGLDGSCNGLQNFSAMLRDPVGSKATNVSPSDTPSDIYTEVAGVTQGLIDADAAEGVAEAIAWNQTLYKDGSVWRHKPIGRKLTKRNTMTRPYSVTAFGMRDQNAAEIEGLIKEGQMKFVTDIPVHRMAYYLADKNLKAIGTVVIAAEAAMTWLQEVAKVVSANGLPVIWTSPIGIPIRQFYTKQHAEKLRFYMAGVQTTVQYNRYGDEINSKKQTAGISPNFIHSADSAHMFSTISLCRASGVENFSMIHDSFGTHACDTGILARCLREAFVNQYSVDILGKFLEEIKEQLISSGAEYLVEQLPEIPPFGDLDLTTVLDSDYFFA
jgi:DNA-directed RNA polymerase